MRFLHLLFAAALLVPGLAEAAPSVLNPLHGNSWDLYVFGNGRVIYDILMGVKMLMVPDGGETGFTMLLLLMATLGFIVLAVAAGFDPAKNLMRMFGYILVVWMVTLFTTRITANVTVNDLVVNRDGVKEVYVVEGVPALVALPAALTSQVGHYFTQVIETYFTVPEAFKVSGSSAGQFNLFAKMIEESNQYGFRYPEMKQSLSAYTADCVVPALALQNLRSPGPNGTTLTGIEALTKSTNLLATYETAKHNAIMTTYYPVQSPEYLANGGEPAPAGTLGGMGVVMSCAEAYDRIKADMELHAKALLDRGTEAWAKSGIMVPFETAFRSMLQHAAANGSVGAGFSSPNGYIMQQGFLNAMSGAFRTAAIQTGNNELLQSAALSQAEASQKSAWVAGFSMFNNMMGYVFTVLQAFIFAITPMIVVALMVPGLGKSIFTNYAQILIWLTLWMPMLALINFIITLFGGESTGIVLGLDGGLSYNNKGLLEERTKNLVVAAQFLGTMTPMLTWGIVKGAMAFTEFISHGIGSQFAGAAGATAATGNLSMNNMSMDNVSMSKYNTAMASTVGTQSVNAFAGAGAVNMTHDLGGATALMNGSRVDASRSLQEGLSSRISESKATRDALNYALTHASSYSEAISLLQRREDSASNGRAIQVLQNLAQQASQSESTNRGAQASDATAQTHNTTQEGSNARTVEAGVGGKVGGSLFGTGVEANARAGLQGGSRNTDAVGQQVTEGGQLTTAASESWSTSQSATTSQSDGMTSQTSQSSSNAVSRTSDSSASYSQALSNAIATETAYAQSLEHMRSVASSYSLSSGMTAQGVNNLLAEIDGIYASATSAAELTARMQSLEARAFSGGEATMSAFEATRDRARGLDTSLTSSPVSVDVGGQVADMQSRTRGQVDTGKAEVRNKVEERSQATRSQQSANAVSHNAALSAIEGMPLAGQLAKQFTNPEKK